MYIQALLTGSEGIVNVFQYAQSNDFIDCYIEYICRNIAFTKIN